MKYEVGIVVRRVDADGSLDSTGVVRTFEFGDNPLWRNAGAARAVEQTAQVLAERLLSEAQADPSQRVTLDQTSGKPRML